MSFTGNGLEVLFLARTPPPSTWLNFPFPAPLPVRARAGKKTATTQLQEPELKNKERSSLFLYSITGN